MQKNEYALIYEQFRDNDDIMLENLDFISETLEQVEIEADEGDPIAKLLLTQLSKEQPVNELREKVLFILEPVYNEYKRVISGFAPVEKELYDRICRLFEMRGFKECEKGRFLRRDKKRLIGVSFELVVTVSDDGCFIVSPKLLAACARIRQGKVNCLRFTGNAKYEKQKIPVEEFDLFSAATYGIKDVKARAVPAPTFSVRLAGNGGLKEGVETEYARTVNSFDELWSVVSLCAEAACDSASGKKPSKSYLELADDLTIDGLKKYNKNVRRKRVIACFVSGIAFGFVMTLVFVLLGKTEGSPFDTGFAIKIFAFCSVVFSLGILPFILIENYREKNRILK